MDRTGPARQRLPASVASAEMGGRSWDLRSFSMSCSVYLNLPPVSTLDGFRVLQGILPRNLSLTLERTEPYGVGVVVLLLAVDRFTDARVVWHIIRAPAGLLGSLFVEGPFL